MLIDCIGSDHRVILQYVGYSAAAGVMILAFGMLVFSKKPIDRRMGLAIVWLLAIMLASRTVPNLLCRGQAPWTIDLVIQSISFVTVLVLACSATYRQVGLLKGAKNQNK